MYRYSMSSNYHNKKNKRIKSQWAALQATDDGGLIVAVRTNGASPRCLYFKDPQQLKQAIGRKMLLVRKWIVSVPRSWCILKPLQLPAGDLSEAVAMVEFELPSLLPIPPDRLVYGCTQLSSSDNMLDVLVCIVKTDRLNSYLETCQSAGIKPAKVLFSSLAIQNYCSSETAEAQSGPAVITITDDRCAEVITCVEGNLRRANQIQSSDTQYIVQEILHQLAQLPTALREETTIILGGSARYTSQLKSTLASELHNKIIILDSLQIHSNQNDQADVDSDNYSYDAAIAAGLVDSRNQERFANLDLFNLLPQDRLKKHARKAQLANYLTTGCLSVLFIALLWLSLAAANWRTERLCRQIDAQIEPIKHIAGQIEAKRRRIQAITNHLSNRGLITRVFEDLYRHTPDCISLSNLNYIVQHNAVSVQLKGQADILSNAFGYTEAMDNATALDAMQIENAQQISKPGGSVVEFSAGCTVK